MKLTPFVLVGALLIGGCHDENRVVGPRDAGPPAAPRGLRSITGDHEVFLSWLSNTESDVAGYRVFIGNCADCEYTPIGQTTGTTFVVDALANGQTRYYAVAAFDRDGNESDLSYDIIFDTPRPEGFDLRLSSVDADSTHAGYDFSNFAIVSYSSTQADIFYATSGSDRLMIAPFVDTEIQDAGYASSLDAVDFAPQAGWSPTGTVELIVGHCYVVRTRDGQNDHYAKFRVTSLSNTQVVVDWAYQVDPNNRELRSRPEAEGPRQRRPGLVPFTATGA